MNVTADTVLHPPLRVAVIGAGHGSAELARNFAMGNDWELVAICDLDRARAESLAVETGNPAVVTSLDALLTAHDIDAVTIATPARTHHAIAVQAIAAGRHVLLEKPLACSTTEGLEMVTAAESSGTVLMAAHEHCYVPAVLQIRELITAGELGEILYVDSVRIDLSAVQPDSDVFWDLAPHDLSILDCVLPGGLEPQSVSAQGADPMRSGKACVGYLSLPLSNGALAHIHVSWLSPTKVQRMVIGGSRKTLVWDELNPHRRLSVVDRAVDLDQWEAGWEDAGPGTAASDRLENAWSSALSDSTPFALMVSSFAAAIRDGRLPPTDGRSALRVLSVLEAATTSLEQSGARTQVPGTGDGNRAPAQPVSPGSTRDISHRVGGVRLR